MNSDPTCYFTLYGMTAAIQVENTLRDMYNSVLTGGFMSFIDTLAGEETDPYKLLQAFGNGAMEGLKSSAITASLTAVRNLGCLAPKLAMLSSLALVGLSGKSTFEALQGAVDSLLEGNYKQALFRALGFGLSAYGTYRASATAFDTMTGVVNGSKCFVAGTLVLTEDGEKPIEEIEVGDYVYASDPETGESGYKEVLNVFIRQSNIIIRVFVNGEEIETTPTHPFWVENEWVPADKLKSGDVLTLADGTTCAIDRVYAEFTNKAITVYNFEVADFHSYYVTDTGVLVHNAAADSYGISQSSSFEDLMTPEEAERYNDYWKQGAGSFENRNGVEVVIGKKGKINTRQRLQVSPGTRSIFDVKYGKNGMYYRETIFDEYGRRIGNNDYTNHGRGDHTNPHYHANSPFDPQMHGNNTPGLHPQTPNYRG